MSVTSAVGGIGVAKPQVLNDIQAISIVSAHFSASIHTLNFDYSVQAFLVALFLVQRFGTARITMIFAPVTFLWLVLLASTGIYNISKYPGVFRAFDPSRAVACKSLLQSAEEQNTLLSRYAGFIRTKDFDYLAGVLLAITGCEAMFAKSVSLVLEVQCRQELILNSSSLGQFNAASIRVGVNHNCPRGSPH